MPDTREELEERYEAAVKGRELWQREEEELSRKLGKVVPTSLAERHQGEADAMTLFDRMSSAEITELYQSDKPAWEEMMLNVRSAGERKLEKLNRPR